jgi:uncharacterized protein with PIN domain
MSRCPSCNNKLEDYELEQKIKLPDGTLVPEEFCNTCLRVYVLNPDHLDHKFYAHEDLSKVKYNFSGKNSE